MARIIRIVLLATCYQVVQSQQDIHWGRFLCGEVEGKCKQHFLGRPGVRGVQGDVGPRGLPGPKGIRGDRGSKGFAYLITNPFPLFGQKGRKGESGYEGERGLRGEPGYKGTSGDPGDKGESGLKGDKGHPGFPGLQGPKGPPGISASLISWKTCVWKRVYPLQEYGLLKECIFNKTNPGSVLHVIFEGSMRVGYCTTCCKRWFFAFDGIECQDGNIEAKLEGIKKFAGMEYRHVRMEGHCTHPAGRVSVELWVEDCPGHQRAPKVPFVEVDLNPRITVEEISLTEI